MLTSFFKKRALGFEDSRVQAFFFESVLAILLPYNSKNLMTKELNPLTRPLEPMTP
jgi:hypothetical protein